MILRGSRRALTPKIYARMACKPDSVLCGCPQMDDHSSGAPVARRPLAANPDRLGFKHPRLATRGPYLALLPVGLAVPHGVAACAVGSYPTVSPFPDRSQVVCSLWRFPWGCPRRALPGTVLFGVRTFLDPGSSPGPQPSSHPRTASVRSWRPSRQRGNGGQGR